jgi:type I restriction enzyme S subunit
LWNKPLEIGLCNKAEKKSSVTEEQLLKDFYAWSEEKKRFGKNEVLNGFKWMKVHSITPKL